jgi:hypothetical protein
MKMTMNKLSLQRGVLLLSMMLGACATTSPNTDPLASSVVGQSSSTAPRGGVVAQLHKFQEELKIGEWLSLAYRSNVAGYASLYAVNSSGKTMQLMINQPVAANSWQHFPAGNDSFDLKAMPPVGVEHYILLVTKQPLNPVGGLQGTETISELALSPKALKQRLGAATSVLKREAWGQSEISLRLVN